MARRGIPAPNEPVIDTRTGLMTRYWYDFFRELDGIKFSDLKDVSTTAPANGEVPVWDSTASKWTPGAN